MHDPPLVDRLKVKDTTSSKSKGKRKATNMDTSKWNALHISIMLNFSCY
jgi:hypothetical protein